MNYRILALIALVLVACVGGVGAYTVNITIDGSNGFDGYARNSTIQPWPSMYNTTGNSIINNPSGDATWYVTATSATVDSYNSDRRYLISIPTDAASTGIAPEGILTSGSLWVYPKPGTSQFNGLGNTNAVFVDLNLPDPSNASFTQSDFQHTTRLKQADNITVAAWLTTGYNKFTNLNLSSINRTGNSTYMLVTGFDYGEAQPVWSASQNSGYLTNSSQAPYNKPIFQLTYAIPPKSIFTAGYNPTYYGNPTYFTDQSTNETTSWNWSFGDGTTSTLQNPSHTYATTGTYTVTLSATNIAGASISSQTVSVSNKIVPINLTPRDPGYPGLVWIGDSIIAVFIQHNIARIFKLYPTRSIFRDTRGGFDPSK